MRFISADKLKVSLDRYFGWNWLSHIISSRIDEAEAVDAIEIVRCKDCKSYDHGCCVVMRYAGDDSIISMKPDDFFSYGKRKED